MAQKVYSLLNGKLQEEEIPDPRTELLPGVKWGKFQNLFTAAFWWVQAWQNPFTYGNYKLGSTLTEEVCACLLGGYGMSAELGLAAFDRVRAEGMLSGPVPPQSKIYSLLSTPFQLNGRSVRYRYPTQKSRYLHNALQKLSCEEAPIENHICFRNWLMEISGIGRKTASWITRNWLSSDEVAIIDIHIYRAGLLLGLYRPTESVASQYDELESRFIAFAIKLEVRVSILDNLMWQQMRAMGKHARNSYGR